MECNVCGKIIKNNGCLKLHIKSCNLKNSIKNDVFNSYHIDFLSIMEIMKKYKISKNIIKDILGGTTRNLSESGKIARQKYPEKFKHTEESKKKIREARLKYMKDNPDKTAWRKKNISYPEKLFLNKITELGWGTKYSIEREYPFFPYFIDFAFLNEKVAVEIDGSQHLLPERIELDNKKDKLLIENKWIVVRATENEIKTNLDNFIIELSKILESNPKENNFSFGIFKKKIGYISKRNYSGLTKKEINRSIKQRKVVRPNIDTLKNEIKEFGYLKTGKIYGVSDNSIRKWVSFYEKFGDTHL